MAAVGENAHSQPRALERRRKCRLGANGFQLEELRWRAVLDEVADRAICPFRRISTSSQVSSTFAEKVRGETAGKYHWPPGFRE